MPTSILTFDTTEAIAAALVDALSEGDGLIADAAGAFDLGDGTWRVEAYFPEPPEDDDVRATIAAAAFAAGEMLDRMSLAALLRRLAIRPLGGEDWNALRLDALPAIRAGRFRVFGEHNRPQDAGLIRRNDIVVEASTAFGTGDHASTWLSLLALDAHLCSKHPRNILDLGTGTGILAIAAAKAAPTARITASDIEPVAIRMSEINRRLNGVDARIRIVLANGLEHPVIQAAGRFDLVLANILPAPLTHMAGAVVARMAPGATLILAGLRIGEQARVAGAYRNRGLTLVRRLAAKEWSCLVLTRPS